MEGWSLERRQKQSEREAMYPMNIRFKDAIEKAKKRKEIEDSEEENSDNKDSEEENSDE